MTKVLVDVDFLERMLDVYCHATEDDTDLILQARADVDRARAAS